MSFTSYSYRGGGRRLLSLALLLAFCLVAPIPALADAPDQDTPGSEPCAECHWSETAEWSPSHHAAAGVSCTMCHGSYVEDHPEKGMMTLSVEAETCHACHSTTYDQWKGTLHAAEGVNCINCHVPHSQTIRLSAERLCLSCHTDGDRGLSMMTPHKMAGVTCIDCHVTMPAAQVNADAKVGKIVAPSHEFTAIPSQLCLNCHASTLHKPVQLAKTDLETASVQVGMLSERAEKLAEQLNVAEKKNASLQGLAILTLGLGLGIGVALGLIAMLVFGYITQNREASS